MCSLHWTVFPMWFDRLTFASVCPSVVPTRTPFPAPLMGKAHSQHAALSCPLSWHKFSASVPSYFSGSGPPLTSHQNCCKASS